MPRGTFHSFKGTLRWSPTLSYLVEVDGGGFWTVGIGWWAAKRMENKRVYVEGIRAGFNDLAVTKIRLVDAPPRRGFWDWLMGRS